ncbi:CapA family protein [Polluticaenibacter yanchengensis]|uniref:CapA family protein n=1 Tax=Polluticaenibacter yanchengensis TaxID=3014562 RepID=A0ABT4UNN7_9BACT|nr:CapA family protein [Chitinophagaceae bacterium LY-5]
MNYKKYNPVRGLTLKGKLLLKSLRAIYRLYHLAKRPDWNTVIPDHHEDPLKMTLTEKLYMGNKYYYKAMIKADAGSDLESHFQKQTLEFSKPENFIPTAKITMSAGGDLIPYTCITPESTKHLWDDVGNYYFNNDIVLANLETVASLEHPYSAAPEVMLADMFFNIDEKTFDIFSGNHRFKGFDVLSTANNHTMDLGEQGVLNTISFLEKNNIPYTGTAKNKESLHQFPILERNGIQTAFIAATFSLNKETLPEGKEWLCNHRFLNEANPDIAIIIEQAKIARERGADMVVACLHMGCAYQAYPSAHTVKNIHNICKQADIDILIAGHPHNAQPFEILHHNNKQSLIAYSLGDFIAYDIFKWCHLPLIIKVEIEKGTVDSKPHTIISKFEVKPVYMYLNKDNELRLLDFMTLTADIDKYIKEPEVKKEVKELEHFFHNFIIRKHQKVIAR